MVFRVCMYVCSACVCTYIYTGVLGGQKRVFSLLEIVSLLIEVLEEQRTLTSELPLQLYIFT